MKGEGPIPTADEMFSQWMRGFSPHLGVRIVETHHLPKVFSHMETVRFPAHPFIQWLSKWLLINPYVEATYKRYRDSDAVIDNKQGILYCLPRQARIIEQLTREKKYETQGLA